MPIDWGTEWLQSTPEAQFQTSVANQRGRWTPRAADYWGGQFGNLYGKYFGDIGQRTQRGQSPQSFGDYLGSFPWQTQFQNLPRFQQGWNTRQFAPSLRHLLY